MSKISCLVTVLTVVILDQATKYLVVGSFVLGEITPVLAGFFNLTLAYNKGAAFGMFSGISDGFREAMLALTTITAFAVIVFFMRSDYGQSRMARLSFMLIIGGAIGNIIDRIRLGYVIDFLDVYYQQYHWPAFNVADSCICLGVMLLMFMPVHAKTPAKD